MAACDNCFFHETGYMWNGCRYFETECFWEPNTCDAFSEDGSVSADKEQKIYEETDGAFGKRKEEAE